MKKTTYLLITALLAILMAVSCKTSNDIDENPMVPCLNRAVFADHSQSQYVLPYPVGESYELVQSYCTPNNSHNNQLSYDFLMPIGAEILASRSGIVVELVSDQPDSEVNGPVLGEDNHVNIQHDDGSVGFYAHFKQNSICVQVGERVEVGQFLGFSGNSGCSLPHLHFGVYQTWPPREGFDLPVNFRNTDGHHDERGGLIAGEFYLSLPY